MAGGKLTPRQKMINMMYLVLTAMLALNVSREVMDFLYEDMKSKEESISTVDMQTASLYNAFERAASENETKAGPWRDLAFDVKEKSNNLYERIEKIKSTIVDAAGGYEEGPDGKPTDKPKKLDNREKAAEYFIVKKEGEKLKAEIDAYKAFMLEQAKNNDQITASVEKLFDTNPIENKDGVKEAWVNHNFEHYPLISILSTLTTIQSNIRNTEAQTVSFLHTKIDASSLKFTGVEAVVIPKSNFVTQGDKYEAQVFLAAYDETQEPEITINGQALSSENIKNGRGFVTLPGNSVGEHKWGGKITIKQNGQTTSYDIKENVYNVAPPSVVISPTKMNVLYRSVKNPLEISVPGVDPSKVTASGPGVVRSGNGYIADVTKVSGRTMKISVSVKNDDGTTTNMGSKEFRIKGLPPASGLFLKKSTTLASKGAIKSQPIEAEYEDFPFDLNLKVVSFEIKIEGQPPIQVKGDRLDGSTKQLVDRLRTGSSITIRKIKATTPTGGRIDNIGNISIDVN